MTTKFRTLSIPVSLLDEIAAAAESSGRTIPKEIEHAFFLARQIDGVLPVKTVNSIKTGSLSAKAVLETTLAQSPEYCKEQIEQVIKDNPERISRHPDYPVLRIRKQYGNGASLIGFLDIDGEFKPVTFEAQKYSS